MTTARSKKLDQLYVSRKEFKADGRAARLQGIVSGLDLAFKGTVMAAFGSRFWTRLVNSSKRKGWTPQEFARKVLLRK